MRILFFNGFSRNKIYGFFFENFQIFEKFSENPGALTDWREPLIPAQQYEGFGLFFFNVEKWTKTLVVLCQDTPPQVFLGPQKLRQMPMMAEDGPKMA